MEALRKETMELISRMLRVEVNDPHRGLAAVKDYLQKNPNAGIVWLFSHNLRDDGLAMMSLLRGDSVFQSRRLLMPMSSELFFKKGYRFAQRPLDVTFVPIHTPQVREKHPQLDSRPGLRAYLDQSKDVLLKGGMVALAPQARGRQGFVDVNNPTKAVSKFMRHMETAGVSFAVVPVGISKRTDGVLSMTVGSMTFLSDVLQHRQEPGGIDQWAYKTLHNLTIPT